MLDRFFGLHNPYHYRIREAFKLNLSDDTHKTSGNHSSMFCKFYYITISLISFLQSSIFFAMEGVFNNVEAERIREE